MDVVSGRANDRISTGYEELARDIYLALVENGIWDLIDDCSGGFLWMYPANSP